MQARISLFISVLLWLLISPAVGKEVAELQVWYADPLIKIFQDAKPARCSQALAEVARGEHAALQIVIRCAQPIQNLRTEVLPLILESDPRQKLGEISVRFVGYVPVDHPIQKPPSDQLRKPPAKFPDPLLEVQKLDVAANEAQPVWITIAVPGEARAGEYRGDVLVTGELGGRTGRTKMPVAVHVFNVKVGKSRLWVTNWLTMQARHMKVAPQPDTPEYWALLRRYARNMAEHRQNVALVSPLSLAHFQVSEDQDDRLEIDFSRFDQWVKIFVEEAVIGRIEGGHLGKRSKGWQSPFVVGIKKIENGKVISKSVNPSSEEADHFYAQFLPALAEHLRARGWLKKYMQHLADEPIEMNIESYRAIARLIRKYAPDLKIIEACHTKDLVGGIDVWVPQLDYLHRDFEHYQRRQQTGEEVWFYTCIFPQGEYANRFIEQPLLKTRILHWINYRYHVTGYLHWGYNYWTEDSPFTKTTIPGGKPSYLPAGDAWIVYPGDDGPLDSIRHEAMRDGIADYELLCLLAERDAKAAKDLVDRHVLDFNRYNCDVETFRATRRELLKLLSRER